MVEGSYPSLRRWVRRLYGLPVFGYFVRLAISLARLPRAAPYQAFLLDRLEGRIDETSAGVDRLKESRDSQAHLVAELARRLEDHRSARSVLDADRLRRLDAVEKLLSDVLNAALVASSTDEREGGGSELGAGEREAVVEGGAAAGPEVLSETHDRVIAEQGERLDRLDAEVRSLSTTLQELAHGQRETAFQSQELRRTTSDLFGRLEATRAELVGSLDRLRELIATGEKSTTDAVEDCRQLAHRSTAEIEEIRTALGRALENGDRVANRVELVRREVLFELRYGTTPPLCESLQVEPFVCNVEKVQGAIAEGARLNVGCGHVPLDGYVNVDRRDLPGVDIVADADNIPIEARSVREIYSEHLLEHFPREQLRRHVLPHWLDLLRPGGVLRAVVPDAESMLREYRSGRISYDVLREVTFGSQEYDGGFHFNMFTRKSLADLLEEAGFEGVECVVESRRNGQCLELEMFARKPALVRVAEDVRVARPS